ncbi:MAG: zf-TFIIB domain-containing protein [Myxococcota bacterium]|nr:zf-TFIIB domain-containing protein [Myxococcota bacterium]
MRLIACHECHTQYDVTHVADPKVRCRCGAEIENRELEAMEARIYRCASCSAQVDACASECDYCGSQVVRDERKLSLVCPECFSRNTDDARFCTACGVTFAPESVDAKGEEFPCPCCGCLMAARQLIGVAINECPRCNGLWVPDDNLDFLIARAMDARERSRDEPIAPPRPRKKGANPLEQRVQYRKCPVCDGMMARRNFRKTSGVIIDQCPEHGTWLDADELEALAGFVLSGGRPSADAFMKGLEAEERRHKVTMAAIDAQLGGRDRRENEGGGLVGLLFDLLS